MSRSSRLLDLIQALRRRRRPVPAAILARELGVSLRTVYRDIATLVGQGTPIEGEAGMGYVLKPGFLLPPLMFSETELDALLLGLHLTLERGDAEIKQAARDVIAKISAVLPDQFADEAETSGMLAGPMPHEASPHLTLIRQAMRHEIKLRLAYTDKKGDATQRIVWPVAIGFFEAAEVLAAWCEARQDFRHFRLDRINSLEVTSERFPRRRRVLLAEWRMKTGIDRPY
ncbi:YafY family protein [Acetobacter farinalis]|uniref:YafY family protein n=1 Tax=Acetobacter farinalis TaxID=1260984 RepID=A0ABT3Q600_9PROT|nr:YafY family protein [Acetobacter farinalis]MCX2560713.1 YafY family protein [Acetobacter farinalis]NHO29147.1 WYL domain-containing protein [Acetobacter farinalis]